VGTYETEAVVLRTIRYSEADSVLALLTRERGRVSAMAKGARKSTSRLGGRLQPGVRVRLTLHEGRGDLHAVRGSSPVDPHAGLWHYGYRLLAAGCILETAFRTLPEDEASEPAYNLVCRALALIARAEPRPDPARLDPIVLGFRVKLLVVSGLVPRLASCVSCGAERELTAFSAAAGGALCRDCASGGEPVDAEVFDALAALLGRPLAEAPSASRAAAEGVERLVDLVLHEHLGVDLRSTPAL
jgi:DNA repair protein RecO (recombination protein O)